MNFPILIPEKFNKRYPKLNSNRINNFENRFNSRLNYIIKYQLPSIIINKTYNKLISSINNITEIRPKVPKSQSFDDFYPNLFELPNITITKRAAVKMNEVQLRYLLTSESIHTLALVEDYFDILNFTIRNEVRGFLKNALMITAIIRCTLQDNDGRRHDRFIGAGVHFRIFNIDEIDTISDRLSQAFT